MCIYKHLESLQARVHKSLIGNLTRHSFSLFDRNKTQPQTSKTSESTASLSLAERWTITEIRRQSNSVLTYSLLTDVLLPLSLMKTRMREREPIKRPFNF